MKIIQNIKHQYQLKLTEDLLQNSKYSEINSSLMNYSRKSPLECFVLLKNFVPKFLNITSNEKILNDNMVLINSFDESDAKIITNFLKFYLEKIDFQNFEISDYQKELISIVLRIKKEENITQEDIFQNSIFYQAIQNYLKEDKIQFLSNQFAFFSTPSNINFTNIRLTKCYFLLIEHPYKIYQRFKNKLKSKDLAINLFLNSDNQPIKYTSQNTNLMVTRKDWGTHTGSWSDPNVANTLRGSILKKEEHSDNTDEFYASIILHLRQSGFEIPLDYSLISDFISLNPSEEMNENIDISNHEKKALRRYIENISENFGYEL